MVWFRVDDGWHSHPKTVGVSFAARGLWATAGSWCSQHLTDGALPAKMLKLWGAPAKLAKELVASGLWEESPDGYRFHDWSALNPLRADVLGKRADDAQRKRESRGSPRGRPNGQNEESARNESGVTPDVPARAPDPVPSRPFPSDPIPTESAARSETRGAAPTNFAPGAAAPDVLLWLAWERVVHNGMPAGSRPRDDVFNALSVLESRGWGPNRFDEAIGLWLGQRESKAPPDFVYFARDIAKVLTAKPAPRKEPARTQIVAPPDYRSGEA